jgi:hypothetical protein
MYMLSGFDGREYLEQYFTDSEADLAVHIALCWAKAKQRPRLYYKTWNGIKPAVWQDVLRKAA